MSETKKKKEPIEIPGEGELVDAAHITRPYPKNKVEKAVLGGEKSLEEVSKENESETDPEKAKQTAAEIQHLERQVAPPEVGDEDLPEAERKEKAGYVRVNMYETIEPAPTVGHFNVGRELGISRLQARETYSLPKNVADVLVDARKASRVD